MTGPKIVLSWLPAFLMLLLSVICPNSYASVTNFIYMTSPCSGGEGQAKVTTNGSSCSALNIDNPETMWGKGQTYGPVSEGLGGISGVYAPASGHFSLRMYWCSNVSIGGCSRKISNLTVTSASAPWIDSSSSINSQDLNFGGGPSGVVPDKGTMCFSLISPTGVEWGVAGNPRFCPDVQSLPTEPVRCALNYGGNLNIDFGTIERVDLPVMKTMENGYSRVESRIPVTCSGDASITLTAEIQYTPSSFDSEGIMTSNADMAVAVIHNNNFLSPGKTFSLSVEQGGETLIPLTFVAFRNPQISLRDMATGVFAASSTLILTEM